MTWVIGPIKSQWKVGSLSMMVAMRHVRVYTALLQAHITMDRSYGNPKAASYPSLAASVLAKFRRQTTGSEFHLTVIDMCIHIYPLIHGLRTWLEQRVVPRHLSTRVLYFLCCLSCTTAHSHYDSQTVTIGLTQPQPRFVCTQNPKSSSPLIPPCTPLAHFFSPDPSNSTGKFIPTLLALNLTRSSSVIPIPGLYRSSSDAYVLCACTYWTNCSPWCI